MEWNKQQVKNLLLVVCGGIAFYTLLHRLGAVAAGIRWVLNVLAPFLLGSALFISGLSMSLAFNASAVVPMLLGMLLSLVGPIVIFVGQLFILPYENTAFAVFYRQICWERAHPVNHDPRR